MRHDVGSSADDASSTGRLTSAGRGSLAPTFKYKASTVSLADQRRLSHEQPTHKPCKSMMRKLKPRKIVAINTRPI
jgi:hypothetical protein